MLTYNKDTDQLELYDGAAFGPVGSDAGLVHIETVSFTTVASQQIDNLFSSTYTNYRVVYKFSGSTNTSARVRFVDGTTPLTTGYLRAALTASAGGTSSISGSNSDSFIFIGEIGSGANVAGGFDVFNPHEANRPFISGVNHSGDSGTTYVQMFSGSNSTTNALEGLIFFPATGTITGNISVYGYTK
jgi:hypothetical protein